VPGLPGVEGGQQHRSSSKAAAVAAAAAAVAAAAAAAEQELSAATLSLAISWHATTASKALASSSPRFYFQSLSLPHPRCWRAGAGRWGVASMRKRARVCRCVLGSMCVPLQCSPGKGCKLCTEQGRERTVGERGGRKQSERFCVRVLTVCRGGVVVGRQTLWLLFVPVSGLSIPNGIRPSRHGSQTLRSML